MRNLSVIALLVLVFLVTEVHSTNWIGKLLKGLPIGLGCFFPPGDKIVLPYQLWDTFLFGFSQDKWFYFGAGDFIGNDGTETTNLLTGLKVAAKGKNSKTGKPAFTLSIPQEEDQTGDEIIPPGLDHVKWLAFMNHASTKGYPGFDALDNYELSFQTTISGQSYGNEKHPFGKNVKDVSSDLRLGAAAFNVIDFETFMVFDFFITNSKIYAFYERLPFGRGDVLGNYAAFSFQIPVADRDVDDFHNLKVSYDKSKGTVKWLIDNKVVFQVNKIGYLIDRKYMTLDHGGVETLVAPTQLDGGMGLFTLLDGSNPNGKGLVKLSSNPGEYYTPANGNASPSFVDNDSKATSRLWGQGAELKMRKMEILNIRTGF